MNGVSLMSETGPTDNSDRIADCANCGIAVELDIGAEPPVLCARCEIAALEAAN